MGWLHNAVFPRHADVASGQVLTGLWELGNRLDFAMVGPGSLASNLSETKDLGGFNGKKDTENRCFDGCAGCGRHGCDDYSCGHQDYGQNEFADEFRDSQDGAKFDANLTHDLVVNGKTLAKSGAPVKGKVTYVKSSGRLHDPGEISLRLTSVQIDGKMISGCHLGVSC